MQLERYVYKVILTNLKIVWIFFMILTPLACYISWLADGLPRINYPVYYLNLVSVFSYPFVAIIAIKYSWLNYEQNHMPRAVFVGCLPILNIIITIICFNYMQVMQPINTSLLSIG